MNNGLRADLFTTTARASGEAHADYPSASERNVSLACLGLLPLGWRDPCFAL